MTRKHTDCAVLSLLGFVVLGCGGSNITGSLTAQASGNSSNSLSFVLPVEAGVDKPDYVASVKFTIADGSGAGSDLVWTVNAPKNRGLRSFSATPTAKPVAGTHNFTFECFNGVNATGTSVAKFTKPVYIEANGSIDDSATNRVTPNLSMVFRMRNANDNFGFTFHGCDLTIGSSGQLHAQRILPAYSTWPPRYFAVPDRFVHYTQDSGDQSITLTPTGMLTVLHEGSAAATIDVGGAIVRTEFPVYAPLGTVSRTLARQTNTLDWESNRNILWAAMSAGDADAQKVDAIDPTSGAITHSVPVGGVASTLTVSPNSQSMWIGLEGSAAVRKMSLPGESLGAPIAVPFPGIIARIGQIVVDPNDDDRIIVVLHDAHDNHAIVVVDHGTVISTGAPRGFSSAAWAGPNRIIALQMMYSDQLFTFSPSGFVAGSTHNLPLNPPGSTDFMGVARGGKITQIGNSFLTSIGAAFNTQSLQLEHGFAYNVSLPQAITGSISRNRVYTLGSAYAFTDTMSRPGENKSVKLRGFEFGSGKILGSMALNLDTDYFRSRGWGYTPLPFPSVVGVGAHGVAFNTPTAIYFVDTAPGE